MFYEKPEGVSIHGGFPNAATDASLQPIDLTKLLIKNSVSTYLMRITGDEWQETGIVSGDVAIVDRAIIPRPRDIIVWVKQGEFVISTRKQLPRGGEVWGTVTAVIHRYR